MKSAEGRWLDTSSGRRVNLSRPSPESIALEDIAGALSRICRFGGHTSEFYSVAQHSVLVSEVVADMGRPDLRLLALHHDSHEAYLGDMPTPLKRRLRDVGQYTGYADLTETMDLAIGQALGVPMPPSDENRKILKAADNVAFQAEATRLLPYNGARAIRDARCPEPTSRRSCATPLLPPQAAENFMNVHNSLVQELSSLNSP
ncbi:hypothetical protein ACIREE_34950 [Streptomyces sp. NPDC102467]|uniref:hypothetical protein n=1 Tax=Streptomyces sp. NPDC102467 TaxID=3366179 RepID=UPI003822FE90